jgi:membrane protein DedA with SNARE-associated domain
MCIADLAILEYLNTSLPFRDLGGKPFLGLTMPESTHALISALHQSVAHIEPFIQHYGYLALFVVIFVEGCGIPSPGQTILIASAIMAYRGDLRIEWIVLVSFAATFSGNFAGYYVGRSAGRHWLGRLLPGGEKLAKMEKRLNRWGFLLLVAGRYIEGLKQTLGLISGALRMAPARFLLANAVASLCWAVPLALIPYWINQHSGQFLKFSKEYRLAAYLLVAGVICTVLGIGVLRLRKLKPKKE